MLFHRPPLPAQGRAWAKKRTLACLDSRLTSCCSSSISVGFRATQQSCHGLVVSCRKGAEVGERQGWTEASSCPKLLPAAFKRRWGRNIELPEAHKTYGSAMTSFRQREKPDGRANVPCRKPGNATDLVWGPTGSPVERALPQIYAAISKLTHIHGKICNPGRVKWRNRGRGDSDGNVGGQFRRG